ncbi:uncharacterized protein CMU_024340 [Cryptosporidium muris RN66]|uniref:Uncharacterized protein n=1 Tax=Cryptosporidium muris (strain RN66) TaxID=441375 RepID=B6AAM7_CRYMR|nr:uncharacterized protein CMU_024340 [Cryptosporidium muris RN66]EEA05429.1 hypothetical protein, conserved [Cryptosporidium muris RN66]|eukprot:XP_002139778.1 hypothetical protein [Cryptosporidium muris RN66]
MRTSIPNKGLDDLRSSRQTKEGHNNDQKRERNDTEEELVKLLEENFKLKEELTRYKEDITSTDELYGQMKNLLDESISKLKDKDEEIQKILSMYDTSNIKWKSYVSSMAKQLSINNERFKDINQDRDNIKDKLRKLEKQSAEQETKISSYEELIQVDQLLLQQYKLVEEGLRSELDKLTKASLNFKNTLEKLHKDYLCEREKYKIIIEKQSQKLSNLSVTVEKFKGRFTYNIGNKNGILDKLLDQEVLDKVNNFKDEEIIKGIMSPLEYELGILWANYNEDTTKFLCQILGSCIGFDELVSIDAATNFRQTNNIYKDQSNKLWFHNYCKYVATIVKLYRIFGQCNILLQYIQYKAYRHLSESEVQKIINNTNKVGTIKWVCLFGLELGFLVVSLGHLISKYRNRKVCKLGEINKSCDALLSTLNIPFLDLTLKTLDEIFQAILNNNLSPGVTYDIITELRTKLDLIDELEQTNLSLLSSEDKSKNTNESNNMKLTSTKRNIPLCSIDAILNINIALAIMSRVSGSCLDIDKFSYIFRISLDLSEKLYSLCGKLSLVGVHYPIDYSLYTWKSSYWYDIIQGKDSKSEALSHLVDLQKSAFKDITNCTVQLNKSKSEDINATFLSIYSILQKLESSFDSLINPLEKTNSGNESLEIILSRNISEKIKEYLENEDSSENSIIQEVEDIPTNQDISNSKQMDSLIIDTSSQNIPKLPQYQSIMENPKKERAKAEILSRQLSEKVRTLEKELVNQRVLYSSYKTLDAEYKKLQNLKQDLMSKIEVFEIQTQKDENQIKLDEDNIRKLKQQIDDLQKNLEIQKNIPKIKAYSEVDVLEPIYLRKFIRILQNKIYLMEMEKWQLDLAKYNPNDRMKQILYYKQIQQFRQMPLLNSFGCNTLDSLAKKLLDLQNEKKRVGKDYNYTGQDFKGYLELEKVDNLVSTQTSDTEGNKTQQSEDLNTKDIGKLFTDVTNEHKTLLNLISDFKNIQHEILVHRCSMPIFGMTNSPENKNIVDIWDKYTKHDMELRYRLKLLKKSVQSILLGVQGLNGTNKRGVPNLNKHNSLLTYPQELGDIGEYISNINDQPISKMILKLPSKSTKYSRIDKENLVVTPSQWNQITHYLVHL